MERTGTESLKLLVQRVERLVNFIDLKSPKIVVQTELNLIRSAVDELELCYGDLSTSIIS